MVFGVMTSFHFYNNILTTPTQVCGPREGGEGSRTNAASPAWLPAAQEVPGVMRGNGHPPDTCQSMGCQEGIQFIGPRDCHVTCTCDCHMTSTCESHYISPFLSLSPLPPHPSPPDIQDPSPAQQGHSDPASCEGLVGKTGLPHLPPEGHHLSVLCEEVAGQEGAQETQGKALHLSPKCAILILRACNTDTEVCNTDTESMQY